MKVLLDTSFMVAAMDNKIDPMMELRKFGKPELFIIDLVADELKKLTEGKGKDACNANVALAFLGKMAVNIIRTGGGNTDNNLMECAEENGMSVCTIDRKLKEILLRKGIEVITIRQGRYLVRA